MIESKSGLTVRLCVAMSEACGVWLQSIPPRHVNFLLESGQTSDHSYGLQKKPEAIW